MDGEIILEQSKIHCDSLAVGLFCLQTRHNYYAFWNCIDILYYHFGRSITLSLVCNSTVWSIMPHKIRV